MNVITTLKEKQREKQVKYERKVLRELSIEQLKKRVQEQFGHNRLFSLSFSQVLEEGCYDVAIEAYLLGAHFSKFGYHGESMESVKERCQKDEKHLIDTLFNFLLYWGKAEAQDYISESLYYECERYVELWWLDGFEKGQKMYKMRLH
ncbi:YbaK family protein [Peribacillus kribbensis]|uniref:YbaK family protein n=1 Tax=Peribacillus kribbensis TaxID=356658 RepID=UPI0004125E82|nr:YbaK family protein [Peribacillus kribbensis]